MVKRLVDESGGRGGRAGGMEVREILPLDLYDEDGIPGLAIFCRVRQGDRRRREEEERLTQREGQDRTGDEERGGERRGGERRGEEGRGGE